ncbi:hypothetical protein D3C87_1606290 [compost metagenome]
MFDLHVVNDHVVDFCCVHNASAACASQDITLVTRLTAAFTVKCRAIQDDQTCFVLFQRSDNFVAVRQNFDFGVIDVSVITCEDNFFTRTRIVFPDFDNVLFIRTQSFSFPGRF